jgi:hypothetical protein
VSTYSSVCANSSWEYVFSQPSTLPCCCRNEYNFTDDGGSDRTLGASYHYPGAFQSFSQKNTRHWFVFFSNQAQQIFLIPSHSALSVVETKKQEKKYHEYAIAAMEGCT